MRLHAHRLVVDEGAGAAVGELHPAQDQLVLGRDVVGGQQRADRMAGGQLEGGGHLPLLGAVAHQRGVAARAERQREGVEQDRFAGAGLAGQHRQPGGEVDVEPVDQDDVADREPGQHGSCPIAQASRAEFVLQPPLADSPSSKTRMAIATRAGPSYALFCDDVSNCGEPAEIRKVGAGFRRAAREL